MTKLFTTIKIGYTHGINGCSGEYFTTIWIRGSKHGSFSFYGLYGAEERVAGAMRNRGFEEFYTSSIYGQLRRGDITKWSHSEYTTVNDIKSGEIFN